VETGPATTARTAGPALPTAPVATVKTAWMESANASPNALARTVATTAVAVSAGFAELASSVWTGIASTCTIAKTEPATRTRTARHAGSTALATTAYPVKTGCASACPNATELSAATTAATVRAVPVI